MTGPQRLIPIKEEWTATSRKHRVAETGTIIFDGGVASQNYRDEVGQWQPIDLTPVASDLAGYDLMVDKAPYKVYYSTTGARRIYPDRNDRSKYIEYPATGLLAGKQFIQTNNELRWESAAFDIVQRWENDRVALEIILNRPVVFNHINFDTNVVGLSDTELAAATQNLKVFDSSPGHLTISRAVSVSRTPGDTRIDFDLSGMTFPVTIDPTFEKRPTASADDCSWGAFAGFTNTRVNVPFGKFSSSFPAQAASRFLNVTIPKGATIDVAYVIYIAHDTESGTVVRSNMYIEDVDDAAQITSKADWDGRNKGTAVPWDDVGAWTAEDTGLNTPSIVTPVQTVVYRAGWASGNAMQFHHFDNGSDNSSVREPYSYDGDTAKAPQIHIEYTPAAGFPHSQAVLVG